MAAPATNYGKARNQILQSIQNNLDKEDIKILEDEIAKIDNSDKKAITDQAFRDCLRLMVTQQAETESLISLISKAADSVQSELCSASTLFLMLSDLFDTITMDKCDETFKFVEERVHTWKSETFYNAGKNYLLRMCNDLLRRLSKSQNTVFCGRIQLFLARLFPLSEKSGLNLMSQFNLENVTSYNTKAEDYDLARKNSVDEKDESMEIEEGEMDETTSSIPIDYNLYRKFWSLQDYFRKPTQCYDKVAWKTFTNFADEVLGCFDSYKLDDTKSSRRKLQEVQKAQSHAFFAKYLTSEKLLDLQLSDSNFRRYVLVQFLILFQYLHAPVKFKGPQQILADDQAAWIKQTNDKIYQALRETPPDGDKYAKVIEHMLSREENWNNWKNDGCPSFVRTEEEKKKVPVRAKKRSVGDDLKASGGKLIKMGNGELTRLWNVCPENMDACRSQDRNYIPTIEEYFEDAIEQNDPEAMVDEEYKLINDPNYAWKSLRLLAKRSPYFFAQQPGNQAAPKTVSKYLDSMLGKLAKDMPAQNEEVKTEVEETMENDDQNEEDQLDKDKQDEASEASDDKDDKPNLVTKEVLETLATKLGAEWKKLAMELNVDGDDIAYFESENPEVAEQALKMLTVWAEGEGDRATAGVLRHALKEIGQVSIATDVFGENGD